VARIFVTGIGIISALGETVESNHLALKEGKCGITSLELFATRYSQLLPFAEIKIDNNRLKEILNINEPGITRTSLLALHAFNEAITDSALTHQQLNSPDTALIGATTVGGMCLTDELYHDANKHSEGSAFLSSYDFGSVSIFLQQKFQIGGIVNTINTACSSSANAIMYGARLIKNGLAKRVIVGGTDSLAKFTINGFNSLMILAPNVCKPFNNTRNGLNLGEGAAFLVLESEETVAGKKVYAELSGYCNANDAFHPSSLSDDGIGPFLAMKGALESANISPDKIDFINAHGTGTENNDEVESKAMIRLFNNVPAFASTKSNIGHTLGAAGAIEAVYSIFSLMHQEVYPSLNFNEPIVITGLIPVQSYKNMNVQHVLSNSFGFGGNCTSLIFSKV
jgi:3-oxoacyl-(acyl-carrier-protein) synthase